MSTPEPNPYRKLNYPVNNLAQDFNATEKDQVRQNIGIPSSVNKAGKVLKVDDNTGNLSWEDESGGGGTVTDVTVNGTSVVSGGVASVTVPTKTSDLTNDSGFITASDIPAQEQADWNESDSSDPSYIKNKPTIPSKTSDLQNDSGYITGSEVPAHQVQSDWTEADSTDPAYILHKPNQLGITAGNGISVVEDTGNNTLVISNTYSKYLTYNDSSLTRQDVIDIYNDITIRGVEYKILYNDVIYTSKSAKNSGNLYEIFFNVSVMNSMHTTDSSIIRNYYIELKSNTNPISVDWYQGYQDSVLVPAEVFNGSSSIPKGVSQIVTYNNGDIKFFMHSNKLSLWRCISTITGGAEPWNNPTNWEEVSLETLLR